MKSGDRRSEKSCFSNIWASLAEHHLEDLRRGATELSYSRAVLCSGQLCPLGPRVQDDILLLTTTQSSATQDAHKRKDIRVASSHISLALEDSSLGHSSSKGKREGQVPQAHSSG